jgi:hypothetical protein
MHAPSALVPVNGHEDLGIAWREVDRAIQNDKVRAELPNLEEVAIDRKMHPNIR